MLRSFLHIWVRKERRRVGPPFGRSLNHHAKLLFCQQPSLAILTCYFSVHITKTADKTARTRPEDKLKVTKNELKTTKEELKTAEDKLKTAEDKLKTAEDKLKTAREELKTAKKDGDQDDIDMAKAIAKAAQAGVESAQKLVTAFNDQIIGLMTATTNGS